MHDFLSLLGPNIVRKEILHIQKEINDEVARRTNIFLEMIPGIIFIPFLMNLITSIIIIPFYFSIYLVSVVIISLFIYYLFIRVS